MSSFTDLNEKVLDKKLCCSCGTCIGICPIKSITYNNEKIVNLSKRCINCGKCLSNCPGIEFDFIKYNKEVFNIDYSEEYKLAGYFKYIYSGYSIDKEIRSTAASGGVITSILVNLFENGSIDGAVVIGEKIGYPTEYEAKIVYNADDVKNAAKSKYKLIPTNTIIDELKKLDGKFAFVGLPCQIQGLRKAMNEDSNLNEKIFVTIGLFCGFNLSKKATDFLINKSKMKVKDIEQISYRKKINNSTGFYVKNNTGKEFFINKHGYTFLNLFYSPKRCWMCYDYTAEFADISVGDAWEQGEGWSRIIIRTSRGNEIIKEAESQNNIYIEKSSIDRIVSSQKKIISYKKSEFWYRKNCMKNFPKYNLQYENNLVGLKKAKASFMYRLQFIGQSSIFKFFINLIPIRILEYISIKLRK